MVLLQTDAAAAQQAGVWGLIFWTVAMFAIFYFLLWRPQQVQQKKRREMLQSLRRGDKVITVGGIYGEITAIRDDVVTLRIADGVEIKISRNGIGSKRTVDNQAEA